MVARKMPLNIKALVITVLAAGSYGCRSTGTIEAARDTMVTQLTPKYEIQRRLGAPPVEVDVEDAVARYLLEGADGTKQFLVVIDPINLNGPVDVDALKSSQGNYVLRSYNQYFDETLRIHRLILRGQFSEAKRLISKTNNDYDLTYGTMILSGLIAVLENDQKLAAEHFRMAKSLYPDDEALKGVGQ